MPFAPDNHEAYDYAERIRERLPRRLQELRGSAKLSMYALALESGISREDIGKIKGGFICPTMGEPQDDQPTHVCWMSWTQHSDGPPAAIHHRLRNLSTPKRHGPVAA